MPALNKMVVASPSIQHDWYQNSTAELARHELATAAREAVLAQLPGFLPALAAAAEDSGRRRGALYDEAFAKLARFQQAWRAMDLVAANRCRPSSWT